jgi:hypothetical protein
MLNGFYRREVTNRIALKALTVPVIIPNPNTAVESGESREPFGLSLIHYMPKQAPVVIPSPQYLPIEKTGAEHTGNPVKAEDFPMDFYLGNPI